MVRILSCLAAALACLSLEGERRAGADRTLVGAASAATRSESSPRLAQEPSPSTGGQRGGAILPTGLSAPMVRIEAAPATATNRTTATFRFAAPGAGAPSFRCAVDRGAMTACTSPWTRTNLAEGSHTFRVQLVGPGRRVLATALHRWAVDLTPPVATIGGGPSGETDDPTPTFSFSLDSPADLAECRITTSSEMPPMQRCASPYTAPALRGGAATFELRVRDAAGNDVILTRSFTVVAPGSAPRTGVREPSTRS